MFFSVKSEILYIICLVAIYFAVPSIASPTEHLSNQCCAENANFNYNTTKCTDGRDVKIQCTYVFVTLPDRILRQSLNDDNSTIRSVHDVERLLPEDKYCLIPSPHGGSIVAICESEITSFQIERDFNYTVPTTPAWKFYFYSALMSISGLFCIVTILTYASFSELWNTQDKLIMYTIFSLLVVTMTFNFVHLNPYMVEHYCICVSLAFILYFFTLALYFWLNIVGFNIWRQIWFKKTCCRERILHIIYNLIGWGGPLCFLHAALVTNNVEGDHLKPSFGVAGCWFMDLAEIWTYCAGPIALLLTIDILYIVLSSWRLCRKFDQFDQLRFKTLQYRKTMYLKLVLTLGSDWFCEILSQIWGSEYLLILLEIVNSLQGVFVFIILVVQRTKVKKILVVKKPLGINFPKSWTELPDQEYDTMLSNAMHSIVLGNHWNFFVYRTC